MSINAIIMLVCYAYDAHKLITIDCIMAAIAQDNSDNEIEEVRNALTL